MLVPSFSHLEPIQGMLDKAQQLNTSAREVFEFTARCCSTASRGHGVGSSSGGGRSAGSSSRSVGTLGSEQILGDCSSGGGPPSSPVRGGTAAGAVAVAGERMTASDDVENFSLSDEGLNEGDALLFKIRRSTSAPTNPDDRALKPKARQSVHPGVRHRVEVCCGKLL